MANWDSLNVKPAFNDAVTVEQNFNQIKFGDGYGQRLVFGLPTNKRKKIFTLTYNVSKTVAATINNFLDARFDSSAESFDFTPPDETTAIKVICIRRRSQTPFTNRRTINLTFEQVFEP